MRLSDSGMIIFSYVISFVVCFISIPSIIRLAEIKHLFDEPDTRKQHVVNTPTLGGVAIFAAFIFSLTLCSNQNDIVELQYIICSVILLFFMGIKDDLFNLVAYKKLLGQLIASFIIVHWAGIKITTFYGLFGIWNLELMPSYVLSIFTIVVITNSFNLIDGIDGLAASVGLVISSFFGIWFYNSGITQFAVLASCMGGALLGFLFYNRSPAKIFMGDTGSLIVGIVLAILAIKFIEMNRILDRFHVNKVLSVPVVTLAVLVIPLFDTLRVFMIRILQGKSPLSADRNHIHHLFQYLGFSHTQTTLILVGFNLVTIAWVCYFQWIKGETLLFLLLTSCVVTSSFVAYRVRLKTVGASLKKFEVYSENEDHIQ